MDNVVTIVFPVESEAYKAFTEIRQSPVGAGYAVAEGALIKREGEGIHMVDAFDAAGVTGNDTATGLVVGALVGILAGPLGILLGAGIGALAGSTLDATDIDNNRSALEVTASKLKDGDIAVVALVHEDGTAFDYALSGYDAVVVRETAADVAAEVQNARALEEDLAREAKERMRAQKKAEREERKAARKERVEEVEEQAKEAAEIANAQYASATKEMMDEEKKEPNYTTWS